MADKPKSTSSTDRMRAYRCRLQAMGITEFTIKIKKSRLKKIERIARSRKISVTAAIEELIDRAVE